MKANVYDKTSLNTFFNNILSYVLAFFILKKKIFFFFIFSG